MRTLEGKIALVTGSSRGLGRAEAIALAKAGADVAVIANEDMSETVRELEAIGVRAIGILCDVGVCRDVDRAVTETQERLGGIDILVNNAQVIPQAHSFESWTEGEMRANWESGPLGTFFFMKACFPYMKENGGRIINTCSAAGHGYIAGNAGYAAAKEAIRSLTRSASKEWGQYNICVNAIAPAAITPGSLFAMDGGNATEEACLSMFALKRWGDPERDIGRVVVFLAGPDASYITGDTIGVNGGMAPVV